MILLSLNPKFCTLRWRAAHTDLSPQSLTCLLMASQHGNKAASKIPEPELLWLPLTYTSTAAFSLNSPKPSLGGHGAANISAPRKAVHIPLWRMKRNVSKKCTPRRTEVLGAISTPLSKKTPPNLCCLVTNDLVPLPRRHCWKGNSSQSKHDTVRTEIMFFGVVVFESNKANN